MKWLKKYWLHLLVWTVFCLVILVVQPSQERYYLHDDLQSISSISWKIELFLGGGLFIWILGYWLSKGIKGFWVPMITLLFFLAGITFLFRPFIETTALFVNRQFASPAHQRRFVVAGPGGDTASRDLFLYDPAGKYAIYDRDQIKLLQPAPLESRNLGDTIVIPFRRGLLGINFIKK